MLGCFFLQLKAKTEMLLSAEAAKAAQKANLENNLETAQHALQDKQQVNFLYVQLMSTSESGVMYCTAPQTHTSHLNFSVLSCCLV